MVIRHALLWALHSSHDKPYWPTYESLHEPMREQCKKYYPRLLHIPQLLMTKYSWSRHEHTIFTPLNACKDSTLNPAWLQVPTTLLSIEPASCWAIPRLIMLKPKHLRNSHTNHLQTALLTWAKIVHQANTGVCCNLRKGAILQHSRGGPLILAANYWHALSAPLLGFSPAHHLHQGDFV